MNQCPIYEGKQQLCGTNTMFGKSGDNSGNAAVRFDLITQAIQKG